MNQDVLLSLCPEMELQSQEPLSAHTAFRVGGPAKLMVFPHSEDEMAAVLQARRANAAAIGPMMADLAQEGGPARYQDGQKVTLAGGITAVKTKTTRSNTLMAYVTLEDDNGSIELRVFARTLAECGNLIQDGNAVFAEGCVSVRDEKAPQLLCDGVCSLTDSPEQKQTADAKRPQKLYLKLPSVQSPYYAKIHKLFAMFPGTVQVVLYMEDTKRHYGGTATLHPAMLAQRREWLGDSAVVVKQVGGRG